LPNYAATRVVCSAASWLILAAVALGQPLSGSGFCVEWMAASSPLVVRGVIDEIESHGSDGGYNSYKTVTVRVLETLKGQHSPRLQFVHNHDFGPVRLSDLKDSRQELLLFLDHWMRTGQFSRSGRGYAYARFPYAVKHAVILKPHDVRVAASGAAPPLTAKLAQLKEPEELLETVTGYLRERGDRPPPRGVTIELPPEMRFGYVRFHLTFPADANPDHPEAKTEKPVADFATLRERFAKPPPSEQKPPYVRKQSGYSGVYALEWMAADCDLIVRGVVEDSFFISAPTDPTGSACGVKLRVLETLKGEAPPLLHVLVTDSRDLEALQRDRQELVVFLRKERLVGQAAAFGYQTRANLWDDSVITLKTGEAEALFADLTWHRQPDEILRRLRAIAAAKPAAGPEAAPYMDGHEVPPVFDVHLPKSIAAGSSLAGNEFSVAYLPVDRELEANAQRWAKSDNPDFRWLAGRALIYFPSDRNAALLRTLLDDPATWSRREMYQLMQPLYPEDNPEYLVRWEAWHVLAGWGQKVPKPDFGKTPR